MPTHFARVVAFGPFEVNSASGQLFRNGARVKLQEQPLRVLIVLLENVGEIVSREELRSRIWAEDTFVDFDGSLRVAVRKLREALGDDVASPRYIETVPKRGYRFLSSAIASDVASGADVPIPAETKTEDLRVRTTPPPPWRAALASYPRWTFIVVVALVVCAVATLPFPSRNVHHLTDKDTVVLGDFRNSTGDPEFDDTLRVGLAVQLQQSPFLKLLSEERAAHFLKLMGRPSTERLTPEFAREVCERSGSSAVLNGSVAKLGKQYVLALQTVSCSNGNILDEEQARTARKENVLEALDQVAQGFRRQIGESLKTRRIYDVPLAEATTPSLEALKAYSTGWRANARSGEAAAIPFFKHAVEIDRNFAIAYAALGLMYGGTGESELASINTTKAYELRNRVSDSEKFFITAYYDGRVTGNQLKAAQTCEAWNEAYPREASPHRFLAGFIYPVLGKHDLSAQEGVAALQLDPVSAIGYLMLAYDYVYSNRIGDAEDTLRVAHERGAEMPLFSVLRYDLAFLKRDTVAMDREVASSQKQTGAEDWMSDHEAFVMAYSGRLRAARIKAQHAEELAEQAGHRERAALFMAGKANWEAWLGDPSQGRRDAVTALTLATDREVEYGSALALVASGEVSRAQRIATDLEHRYPEDTSVRFSYIPVLHALIALKQHEPDKAMEALRAAGSLELSTPRSNLQGFFGALYPVFVRGQVYLAARRPAEAAAEFQKIVDHRTILISDPVGVLAYVQLARAHAAVGDRTRARIEYREFLDLWRDADKDSHLLRAARREYLSLR